jgi:peptidoglycan L-alanyl-D-glutamate endopeptidase CwlK
MAEAIEKWSNVALDLSRTGVTNVAKLNLFIKLAILIFMLFGFNFLNSSKALADQAELSLNGANCTSIVQVYSSCGAGGFTYDGTKLMTHNNGSTQVMTCDDGQNLNFYDRMEQMDLSSVLMIPYQTGVIPLPEVRQNWDPGRLRAQELLKAVYGDTDTAAKKNLVRVPFLNQTVLFQRNVGAANALAAVGRDLVILAAQDVSVASFLAPFLQKKIDLRQFTYEWRVVAGTHRLSAHSFGAAIDLLLNNGPEYWLWDEMRVHPEKAKQGEIAYKYDHYIPMGAPHFNLKVVDVFESHGFVWGAKWNHYDTMHFEYRPEFFPGLQVTCAGRSFKHARQMDFDLLDQIQSHVPDSD